MLIFRGIDGNKNLICLGVRAESPHPPPYVDMVQELRENFLGPGQRLIWGRRLVGAKGAEHVGHSNMFRKYNRKPDRMRKAFPLNFKILRKFFLDYHNIHIKFCRY